MVFSATSWSFNKHYYSLVSPSGNKNSIILFNEFVFVFFLIASRFSFASQFDQRLCDYIWNFFQKSVVVSIRFYRYSILDCVKRVSWSSLGNYRRSLTLSNTSRSQQSIRIYIAFDLHIMYSRRLYLQMERERAVPGSVPFQCSVSLSRVSDSTLGADDYPVIIDISIHASEWISSGGITSKLRWHLDV